MSGYLSPELPPIALTVRDFDRLGRLVDVHSDKFGLAGELLAREIERARIISEPEILKGLVTMGSEVEFRDDKTGEVRRVTLVYPDEADVSHGRISVLTPIGAALIGLSETQSIDFQPPSGGMRSLTVLKVSATG
jgi:regulator of nucleoside diphosphate kinase